MTSGERKARLSVWKSVWKCLKNNIDGIALVAVVTAVLRIAVFLPLLLCVDFGGKLPMWMGYALAVAVYIVGVIPMRFWGREKMRRMVYSRHMNQKQKGIYQKWLKTGLLRYLRGILWGLPFLAGTVYCIVYYPKDVKTFWMPIRELARLVGQEPNIGTGFLVALALMAVFGLLFAYGWWRDLPFEYLPARSLGPKKTLHWSRSILKKHRKEMRKTTLVNFLLALPAWIGLGAVLVPYALGSVDFSLSPEIVLSQVLRLLRSPLPGKVLMMIGGEVLLLYVPFWIFRKTRNTVLMGYLMREHGHGFHSSRHEGTNPSSPAAPKTVDFHPGMESSEEKDAPFSAPASEDDSVKEAARKAQEAAKLAQEAAEKAARLAQEAARMAQEAAGNKQE